MKEQTLEILDPWTMPYLEYEEEFIDELPPGAESPED
jgi:hypothetical protein